MGTDISRTPLYPADVPHITHRVPVLASVHVTSVVFFVKISERSVAQLIQVKVMAFH
jgi:hypothetical protein